MKTISCVINDVKLLRQSVFQDSRGVFRRSFCSEQLSDAGIYLNVCQGNISENTFKNTLRGFHYQKSPSSESKILTPITGEIYNVVIDLRFSSTTFLKHEAIVVSASKRESLYVPAGCANAFITTQDNTIVHYYMGDHFKPESYSGFRFDDPFFKIIWPYQPEVISTRDLSFPDFDPKLL